jgi:hypothetical protein
MKRIGAVIVFAGLASIFVLAGTVRAEGPIAARQGNQQERIGQGVTSGALTAGETRRLNREQARIQNTKTRAWRDGALAKGERVHLTRMQNNASRHIARAKHNGRHSVP